MLYALIGAALLGPATLVCLYYLVLTGIGWRPRSVSRGSIPNLRLAILIPAHDEEDGLPVTLRSISESDYPPDLIRVVVVADNCSDRTAAVARSFGAEVIERVDPLLKGKGYALAKGLPVALDGPTDAVVIVDADAELAADCLRKLAVELADGAAVAQAAVAIRGRHGCSVGLIGAVGSEIENGVSAGRDRLGLSVPLRGSGMAFRREVLDSIPWKAFGITEDAEYDAALRRARVRVRFVTEARLRTGAPPTPEAMLTQRRRWRAALHTGRPDGILASKPIVLAHLVATAAITLTTAAVLPVDWAVGAIAWVAGLIALTGLVYVRAFRRVGQSASVYSTAVIAYRLVGVGVAAAVSRNRHWERTPRTADATFVAADGQ
ncbi:glycosyltransferase family 2 protein [Fimbriiglobus ruber]|uniref:Glycosyl transferase family 2 n=1 Tax=Fimbriiglobus ruber TaxID=1908690 RepID=A0A225E4U3_9BACT|nr:glycosyltransferase family 2 protein [Fimbriiglobus ruber]OWK46784.1 glycosyl transferase family 2 [Fimbriiglobus ruber]